MAKGILAWSILLCQLLFIVGLQEKRNPHFMVKPELQDSILNEEGSLQWVSGDHLCDYRCSRGASKKFSEFCASHCAPKDGRRLEEESDPVLMQCAGQHFSVHLDQDRPFDDLDDAFNELLKALSKNDLKQFKGCLLGSESGSLQSSNHVDDGESMVYYVYIPSSKNSREIREFLADMAGSAGNIRYVAETDNIFEVELTKAQASVLGKRSEVESVTPRPSALTLSQGLVQTLSQASVDGIPPLEIYVATGYERRSDQIFKELNELFESDFGVKNLMVENGGRWIVQPLENAQYFSTLVQTLAIDPRVILLQESKPLFLMDLQLTGGAIEGNMRRLGMVQAEHMPNRVQPDLEGARSQRRLDSFTNTLVGLSAAQELGLDGSGVTLFVADSGLYMLHDQFVGSSFPYDTVDDSQRKVIQYRTFVNDVDESSESDGSCGHGTHVTGIAAGKSASGGTDLGVATGAKVSFLDIGRRVGNQVLIEIPRTTSELFTSSVDAGASIASFSWGSRTSEYDFQAASFDSYVYDNDNILVLTAAGNDGDGNLESDPSGTNCAGGAVVSPASAKNVVAVGASLSTNSAFRSYGLSTCDAFSEENMADFSSIGPSGDGRRKPDVVCPGMPLLSAKSLPEASFRAGIEADGTCISQGTSQACPGCAGVAAILYQWVSEGRYGNGEPDSSLSFKPPAALMKALLIHSTVGLSGVLPDLSTISSCSQLSRNIGDTHQGDNIQGFGLVRLDNILRGEGDSQVFIAPSASQESLSIGDGDVHEFTFPDTDGEKAFRATLVWTDPPGSAGGCSNKLVNDVDIEVREFDGNGTLINTYLPVGVSDGSRDTTNNVEVVSVPIDQDGNPRNLTVRVLGSNIRVGGTQKYALVASGTATSVTTPTSSSSGFWEDWMTYTAIGVGVLVIVLVILAVLNSRRKKANYRRQAAANHAASSRAGGYPGHYTGVADAQAYYSNMDNYGYSNGGGAYNSRV